MTLRVLDLFSGIGGFSLGLERTGGFEAVAFCEIEPYPRAVLKKHWPDVPRFHDVKRLRGRRDAFIGYSTDTVELLVGLAGTIDVICGGFPCQDISLAGKGAGLDGERSGLWSEYRRLIEEVRPRYAVIENVSALRSRGLDQVLGSLAKIGYDAEWHCIPASAVGAPHQRDRIWIVAYSGSEVQSMGYATGARRNEGLCTPGRAIRDESGSEEPQRRSDEVAHPDHSRLQGWLSAELSERAGERAAWTCDTSVADTDTDSEGADRHSRGTQAEYALFGDSSQDLPDTGGYPSERLGSCVGAVSERDWWRVEPDVGRVAHGVPSRVDRLRALGNAVVPQIPEIIGQAILAFERSKVIGQDV